MIPRRGRPLLHSVMVLAGASCGLAGECVVQPGSPMRVVLDAKESAKADGVLSGKLGRALFSGTCQAIPKNARVRAVVERVEGRGIGAVTVHVLKRLSGVSTKPGRVTLGSITV